MAFDTAAIQVYATTRGQIRATTDHRQHDVQAVDLDHPLIHEYVRRRAGVEAAWYIDGLEDFAVADRQDAERVFAEAFVDAYDATMRGLG